MDVFTSSLFLLEGKSKEFEIAFRNVIPLWPLFDSSCKLSMLKAFVEKYGGKCRILSKRILMGCTGAERERERDQLVRTSKARDRFEKIQYSKSGGKKKNTHTKARIDIH